MADLGFLPTVRRLLDAAAPEGQRMLFSATLGHAVDVLVHRFLDDPAEHAVDPPGTPAPIVHHLLTVAPADRTAVAAALAGTVRVMAATGIAARGIHLDGIDLVIHADPPPETTATASLATGRGAAAKSASYQGRRRR